MFPSQKEEQKFEKSLFQKTHKANCKLFFKFILSFSATINICVNTFSRNYSSGRSHLCLPFQRGRLLLRDRFQSRERVDLGLRPQRSL